MGIVVKQSLQNTVIAYVGIGLGFVTTILLFPNILSAEEYGLTRVFISFTYVAMHLCGFGIYAIVIKFLPDLRKNRGSDLGFLGIVWIWLTLGVAAFLLLSFIFDEQIKAVYQEKSPLFAEFYLWVLPMVVITMVMDSVANYVRCFYDTVVASILKDVVLRVLVLLELVAVFLGVLNFEQFLTLFVFNYGLITAILIFHLIKNTTWSLKPDTQLLSASWLKPVAKYGLFSLFSGVSIVLANNIDVLMLGQLAGLESTAIYGIAFYLGSVIAVPQMAIQKITAPFLVEHISAKEWSRVELLYKKAARTQFVGGIIIFLLIWINLDVLFGFLPPIYSQGKWVILFIGLGKIFDMATGMNAAIISTSHVYRFDLYSNVGLMLITVITNYLLIPPLGVTGAALATLISILIFNITRTWLVWYHFSMQPLTLSMLGICVVGLAFYALSLILPTFGYWIGDFLMRSLICGGGFFGAVVYFNLVPELEKLVSENLGKLGKPQ